MDLRAVLSVLETEYGPVGWWPLPSRAGTEGRNANGYRNEPSLPIGRLSKDKAARFEIAAGAVLAQNTAWRGASAAVATLARNGLLDPQAMLACPQEQLSELIAQAGTYRRKALYLKTLSANWEALDKSGTREELLALSGIGPETADCILCYAWAEPNFVADAYARRIVSRMGFVPDSFGYEATRAWAEKALPKDPNYLAEAHALLVEHAKRSCTAKPRCDHCVVSSSCGLCNKMVTGPSLM